MISILHLWVAVFMPYLQPLAELPINRSRFRHSLFVLGRHGHDVLLRGSSKFAYVGIHEGEKEGSVVSN